MSSPGGSLQEISLDSRRFSVAADAEATINLGGMSNEVQPNGDGTARIIQTVMPASVEGLQIAIDHDSDDMKFLQDRVDAAKFFPFTLTMVSGHVYRGRVAIVEVPGLSTQNSTCAISLKGEGKLELQ